jgi:hypothetical protein
VDLANATTTAKVPCIGLAMETASSGSHVVLLHGIYRDDSNLTFSTIGGLVYVGTSNGAVTQTQPSSTDQVIQPVGIAIDTHVLYFNPDLNYITHT